MVMVSVEFGGLPELVRAVENYRDNINILYGCQDNPPAEGWQVVLLTFQTKATFCLGEYP